MKNKFIPIAFLAIIVAISAGQLASYPTGAEPGYSSAPGESNCTNCHVGTLNPANGGSAAISITGNPSGYVAGQTYEVNVTVTFTGRSRFGFSLSAKKAGNANVGSLLTNGNTKVLSGITYMTHSNSGTLGNTDTKTWKFNWVAPTTSVGTVNFYASGMAANGTGGNDGDFVYTSSLAFPASTSVNEVSYEKTFLVYPNPAKENINVQFNLKEETTAKISLIDLSGKEIKQFAEQTFGKGLNNTSLQLGGENIKGIYLLKLEMENNTVYKKILID